MQQKIQVGTFVINYSHILLSSSLDDIELKDNRIRALRHLAMKIAAKLNWDLVIIEKR